MQFLSLLALASTALAAAAPVTTDSPQDVYYEAVFSPNAKYNITGSVKFSAATNGSFLVQVAIKDLPELDNDEFPYHVHVSPVPSNGNCTATGGHLNPYNGTANGTTNALKEVGDLAGKHGNLVGPAFETSYIESYLSLDSTDPAFVGNNRSVVIHDINNNRLTCADIVLVKAFSNDTTTTNSSSSSSSSSGSSSSNSTTNSTSSSSKAAAAGLSVKGSAWAAIASTGALVLISAFM